MLKNNYLYRVLLEMVVFFCIVFFVVFSSNFIAVKSINCWDNCSYTYEQKASKGFLTEEDLYELEKEKENYLNDVELRSFNFRMYFGTFFISMIFMSLFTFHFSIKSIFFECWFFYIIFSRINFIAFGWSWCCTKFVLGSVCFTRVAFG